ncbi:MAG: peptide ABC transporter substrate-binding protein [Planctomycetota bacterium]|nr:peptide ABC transporter substrate-binding protein [Planctomycetota bacterium]
MRGTMWLSAMFAALALALAGTAHAQAPQRGGTLIFSVVAEGPTFDCHATDSATVVFVAAPFYSTLLKFDLARYPEIVGDLAESWTVSPDGLTYTFRLRDNVVFHDGTPLTSADVKASYERIRRPAPGLVSARSAVYADIEAIDAPDPRSVVFRLRRPNPSMLQYFASPWNCIYSAARLAQDPNWPAANIMGTGPFRLGEYVAGSHFTGTRFDRYFMPGRPYVDAIRAVFMGGAAMVNSLQGGQIHIDSRGVSPAQRDRLVQAMGDRVRVVEGNMLLGFLITFNTSRPPFDDARVRRAMSMCIDREAITRDLLRAGQVPATWFTPAMPGYEPPRGLGFDRERARRLLAEAGYPDGKGFPTVELLYNTLEAHKVVAENLVQQWRENLGVTVSLRNSEWKVYLNDVQHLQYQIARAAWIGDYLDPNTFLDMFVTGGGNNNTGWSNARYDALIAQAARELDPKKRMAVFQEAERLLIEEEMPVLPLYIYVNKGLLKETVGGWYENVRDQHPLKYLWKEPAE